MFRITIDSKSGDISIEPTFGLSDASDLIGRLFSSKDVYIDYSVQHAAAHYGSDQSTWIHQHGMHGASVPLPYAMLFDYRTLDEGVSSWGRAQLIADFQFPAELAEHRQAMIERMRKEGRIKRSSRIPRAAAFEVRNGRPYLALEIAEYYDQVGTNLTLDFPLKTPMTAGSHVVRTVREWDCAQSGCGERSLPLFSKSLLANTVGVAVGIVARDNRGVKHFVYRFRNPRAPVYPNTWHLPLSFGLEIDTSVSRNTELDLQTLISIDLSEELAHETEILRRDFHPPKPLALCRDLCRGGKPQFFLEMESRLALEELLAAIGSNSEEYRKAPQSVGDGEQVDFPMSPELACYLALASDVQRA